MDNDNQVFELMTKMYAEMQKGFNKVDERFIKQGVNVVNSKLSNLPIDEKIRLVQDLWDSILADQSKLSLTDEQKYELDRRIDAFEADNDKGRLAKDVLSDVRRRL